MQEVDPIHGVSKNGLFEPFIHKKRTFYQGRLGTNIGKALKKGTVFPQGLMALRDDSPWMDGHQLRIEAGGARLLVLS